ncbi:RING finger protein 222 [Trichomycterus rosablanca]|uniref:RING finger protein 222 n=1 Tax=Trichomycterus rosablanca TaxID=2290929 RepID=UPI002F356EBD
MDDEVNTECPVCFESFSEAARTLSCGHAFCHDCLVGIFVSSNREGSLIRDSIICPVCRHVTFVNKLHGLVKKKDKHAKILEVPTTFAWRPAISRTGGDQSNRIGRNLRWILSKLRRQRLVCPKESLQVFIISDLGRPIADEDIIDVGSHAVMNENGPDRRWTVRLTTHCLVFLLIAFTLLALVAATLPWLFLA